MVSQAGWRVERVTVTRVPDGVPEQVFRVTWKGYWQADCATTGEVARHVDLSTLVPVGWAGARAAEHASPVEARARLAARRALSADQVSADRAGPPAVALRLLRGGDQSVASPRR
jgi:hypothetical protein